MSINAPMNDNFIWLNEFMVTIYVPNNNYKSLAITTQYNYYTVSF